jgi:uncharacterized protein YeeX (DUF496 family)
VASLLDPYSDLNIDLDDTVESIWDAKKKKRRILETQNPYSIWSAAKPRMAEASERSYRDLGARNPMISKDAIATSTPLWSALEWFPGTGIGTKMVGMAGSVAALPLKSETMKKLFTEAKEKGIKTAVPIADFMSEQLSKMGYKKGINTKSVRRMQDPDKYGEYDYNLADAIELGYDPIERETKETFLKDLGQNLPDPSNPNYSDNLRAQYKYWVDDEWRMETLAKNSQRKSTEAAARHAMVEKSGTGSLPESIQIKMANSRVRSVIKNMMLDDEKRGGGFYLTDDQIDKVKKQLFKIKLKEIKEGTPLIYRMTIDHYHPRHGVVVSGGQEIGSGLTTWKNITDSNGKLRLLTLIDNAKKSNIIPGRLLHPEQRSWRKLPAKTSIVDLL